MSTSTILPATQPVEGEFQPQSLAYLHTTIVDVMNGHGSCLERAEPDARPMLNDFRDLHARHDAELAAHMARHGQEPDEGGGFASLVHKGMARLRDAFGEGDQDPVPQLADGERRVLEAYNHALENGQPVDVNELLVRQHDELVRLIDRYDLGVRPGTRP